MVMFFNTLRRVALAIAVACVPASNAFAHCFVGERFFPATLITDDPCVADEMSLPTVDYFPTAGIGGPAGKEVDIEADISKRITADFGVTIADTWTQIRTPGAPTMAGFADLVTTFQYQLLKDAPDQLALMVGLIVNWGGTGATNAGIGTSYSTLSPALYVGKGFGNLPDQLSWAQPFAITLEASYDIPSSSFDLATGAFIPQTVAWSGSLQYSLPYLHANVIDLGLPDFFNHLIPLVEASFLTPVANNFGNSSVTTGFVFPGVIWVGAYYQVGLEAIIPINKESGSGVGVIGQLHFYLDDMFPATMGQPLIGGKTTPPPKLPFGG
jgi:hypothetical protein